MSRPCDRTVHEDVEVEPGKTTGLQLQTTRVDLGVGGSVTQDVVIAAPSIPQSNDPADLTASYRLIASQNGQEVASAPVTITEKLLAVTSSTAPQAVSGRFGETRRVTVTLNVSPALDGPLPISLRPAIQTVSDFFTVAPAGSPYGDGGTMRQDFDLTLKAENAARVPPTVNEVSAEYYVLAGDFAGYRLSYYGNNGVSLPWNIVR